MIIIFLTAISTPLLDFTKIYLSQPETPNLNSVISKKTQSCSIPWQQDGERQWGALLWKPGLLLEQWMKKALMVVYPLHPTLV